MTRPPLIVTIPLVLACLPAAHMVAVVIQDVILRYGYNQPLPAAFDIIDRDFAWAVMLAFGAALVWRHDPTEAALSGSQPRPWQRIVGCIVAAVSALCFSVLAFVALRRLNHSIATDEVSLDGQPTWLLHLAPVVGFGLTVFVLIGNAIARFWSTPASDRGGAP
jgi:TRAP-type C4-dicarboxylate transport system permease small subunit